MDYMVNYIRTKQFVRIKANFGIHKVRNRQITLYYLKFILLHTFDLHILYFTQFLYDNRNIKIKCPQQHS